MEFYNRTKQPKANFLDLISSNTKLQMNWDLIKNGANVNEVFTMNPVGLNEFLKKGKNVEFRPANTYDMTRREAREFRKKSTKWEAF